MVDLVPPVADERTGLLTFLEAQREALRVSIRGLTEFEARIIPSASTLSLATLLHHVVQHERRWTQVGIAGRDLPAIWPVTDPGADFRMGPDERVSELIGLYRSVGSETVSIVAAVPDLGDPCALPALAHLSVRWVLLHLIQETARHAGHADIIRESIDGASATMLLHLAPS